MDFVKKAGRDPRSNVVFKTVDEVVNNSNVLQDDDELFIPLLPNTSYILECGILVNSPSGTPDIQISGVLPVGCEITSQLSYRTTAAAWGIDQWNASGSTTSCLADATTRMPFYLVAAVRNGANAGNFQIRWAQWVPTAEDTTVKAGSFIRTTRK